LIETFYSFGDKQQHRKTEAELKRDKGQEVMIEELLRRFAQENFHGADYVPLLHGHLATTKPLSLIIKRKRPLWKIPFARAEIIILADLEKYVSSDSEREYQEAVKKNVVQEQVMEKDKNDPARRREEIGCNIAGGGEIHVNTDKNLGDLALGKLRQEYILDVELRGILRSAALDGEKMMPYKGQELFLITSAVYSEKFEVVGEREYKREVEAGLQTQPPIPEGLISKFFVRFKKLFTPPGVATRNVWGPILVKYTRVQYNEETSKLELAEGEFVGNCAPTRHLNLSDYDAWSSDDDDLGSGDGQAPVVVVKDDILLGPSLPVLDDFTDQDKKNIERIYINVLMPAKSREQQKALVKKYLRWFENLLGNNETKILLVDGEPLTSSDCKFLHSLYVSAIPGQKSVDFTTMKEAEIHRCGLILKLLDELSDEEWEELGIPRS